MFGSWLAWKVLARKPEVTQRLKIKTMPQFLKPAIPANAMKFFACVVIFIFLIPYSASVYKGLASVAEVLLGIPDDIFLIIIAILSALILVFGGYLVQARADFFQGIVIMIGVTVLIVAVIWAPKVGGFKGIADYAQNNPLGLPSLDKTKWLALISLVLMTSFGTWGLPHMIQKYYGIKDDKQAKRGIKISTFFAVLVAGGGYFIGSLCHRFFTMDEIGKFNENPKIVQDYIVPNIVKTLNLPDVFLGIVIVLLLAASVSTLCSLALTASSTLTLDFIKPLLAKKMADKKMTLVSKILCVLFVAISYFVATNPTPILDMMSYSWGIISGSFLAPYVLALFWKGMNKVGAWVGILSGFIVALPPALCKLIMVFTESTDAGLAEIAGKGPNYAVLAMLASLVMCVVGSLLAKTVVKKDMGNEFFYNGVVEAE